MAGLEIHPLSDLRDEAATLFAERYARQRVSEPLLPDVSDFSVHVPEEEGVVATRSGKPVAYLAGAVEDDMAWVRFGGCAASEPEAIRDLFAVLAERWGVTRFQVAVPASEDGLLDAFFRLAFGCQAVWAVRETEPAAAVEFGGTIRPSTQDDLDAIAQFDEILWVLQARTPTFSGRTVPSRDEFREERSSLWDEGDEYPAHFVVDQDGRIGSVPLQVAFLGVLFAVIALTSDALYALLADLLTGKLRRTGTGAKLRRWVSGGIFIALGVTAATAHRVT
jgi:hypothetical protein